MTRATPFGQRIAPYFDNGISCLRLAPPTDALAPSPPTSICCSGNGARRLRWQPPIHWPTETMCTVTFIAQQNGYLLGMNRDEKLTRPEAIAPTVCRLQGRSVLAPSEPGGG